jgi:hypothetical protein
LKKRVYLAQVLCGKRRHAIVIRAGEVEEKYVLADWPAVAEAIRALVSAELDAMVAGAPFHARQLEDGEITVVNRINPWCDLCLSPRSKWMIEVTLTTFTSKEEAEPMLRQNQAEQREGKANYLAAMAKARDN